MQDRALNFLIVKERFKNEFALCCTNLLGEKKKFSTIVCVC